MGLGRVPSHQRRGRNFGRAFQNHQVVPGVLWHMMTVPSCPRPHFYCVGLQAKPGTYALVLKSTKTATVRIGKLGSLQLQPGFYVYVGSAHGPGGLHARLAHHLEPTGRPHWHVDYLRQHTKPQEVWFCCDRTLWEHRWAHCLGMQRGASVPLAGFGSSDCTCETHLFFFRSRPSRAGFARSLRTIDRTHPLFRLRRLKP
jgi:Uri superfamily endonuclease